MKKSPHYLAILASALLLNACATTDGVKTMDGKAPEATPPTPVTSVAEVPTKQLTRRYKIIIYPGTGANFNPKPTMTLDEYNDIRNFDYYCALQAKEMEGEYEEMLKHGAIYGGFQGLLGALGYRLGFGSAVSPGDYLVAIGLTGLGGGLGSGKITFESAVSVLQGYCMTLMAYKADELESKMRRVSIAPLPVGGAQVPAVTDKAVPAYPATNRGVTPLPPH